MFRKLVGIQEAADFLGVCPQALRRQEREWTCPDRGSVYGRDLDAALNLKRLAT
jgi:transposase